MRQDEANARVGETPAIAVASAGPARHDLPAVGLLILLVAIFLSPWWNRYFGGTLEGYFPYYGLEIDRGQVPYRDFYLHVPPLLPLESALIERLGEHALIAARAVGALERILLALALFAWLRQLFRAPISLAATLIAIALAATDDTEVLLLYNHQSILLGVIAGLLATLDLGRARPRALAMLGSGAAAGLALMCKQTSGAGVIVAVAGGLVVALAGLRGARAALRGLALWSAGLAVAVAPVLIWLGSEGALPAFVQQVFRDGAANKGPLLKLAERALEMPWLVTAYRVPEVLALAGVLLFVRTMRRGVRRGSPARGELGTADRRALAAIALLGALPVAVGVVTAPFVHLGAGWLLLPERWAALTSLWGSLAILLLCLRTARILVPTPRVARLGIFAAVSLALAYMLSLSWSVQPAMALPGFALVAALITEGAEPERLPFGFDIAVPRAFVLLGATLLLFATWDRQIAPFDFAGWREPPLFAPRAERAPAGLEGFRLSRETAAFVEEVVGLVRAGTRPGDRVLAFSQIPFVELLAGRERATFAAVHWFDVTPDRICREDLVRLVRDPPEALVLWPLTDDEIALHERVFRDGRPSGQRELWAGLRELARERYRLAGVARAPGGVGVEVWTLAR